MDFDVPLSIAGRVQKLIDELLDDLRREPGCAQTHKDFTGGQVFGLHLFQRLHMDGEVLGIHLGRPFCPRQLLPYIAGEILVGHQVFRLGAVPIPTHGVQEDDAFQLLIEFRFRLAGQGTHIVHVDPGFLRHRHRKGFTGGVNGSYRHMGLDRPLGEDVRLAFQLAVIIQNLQCGEERKRAVLRKGGHIGSGIDKPIFCRKAVVQLVELLLSRLYLIVWEILCLDFKQVPYRVPYVDQTLNAVLRSCRYLHGSHAGVFTVVDFVVQQRVGEVADCGVSRDGIVLFGKLIVQLRRRDFAVDIGNRLVELACKVSVLIGRNGHFLAEPARYHLNLAQHHFGVLDKVRVHPEPVFIGVKMNPIWLNIHESVTLLQDENVRYHLRTGVALEGIVGQADSAQQVSPLCDILPHGAVCLIHRSFARHQRHDTAWAELVEGLRKEVVVDQEVVLVVLFVGDAEVAKGNIAHNGVKEAVGDIRFLKGLCGDRGTLVELLGDARRNLVQLHAIELCFLHGLRQHTNEVADTAGRFKDIALLKAHALHCLIDALDYHGRGVERRQGAFLSGGVFLRRQDGFQLQILRFPCAVVLIKGFR